MEIIMSYIDSMFAGVPATDETKRLREDITANMSDKYDELIKDGKSANEAIGTVISEFGNIDEVLSEMGITREAPVPVQVEDPAAPHRNRIRLFGALAGVGAGMLTLGVIFLSPFAIRFDFRLGTEFFGLIFALTGIMMLIFAVLVRTKILVGSVGIPGNVIPFLRAAADKNKAAAFKLRMVFGGIQLMFFIVFAISDLFEYYSLTGTIFMSTAVSAAFAASVYTFTTQRAYTRILGDMPERLRISDVTGLVSVPFFTLVTAFSKFDAHYGVIISGNVVYACWSMILLFMVVRVIGEMYDAARNRIGEQHNTVTEVK